jgi:glutamine synthetase
VKAFQKYKVLNKRELAARTEINFEIYVKTLNVEAQVMVMMANRYILPAAVQYQQDLASSVTAVKAAGGSTREVKKLLDRYTKLVDGFRAATDKLEKTNGGHASTIEKHARHMRDVVIPCMDRVREFGDEIEVLTPHELWPLPTYREMLFLK